MQRRSFIGSVLAALAAPMLPAATLAETAPTLTTWNTATLTALLEKRFTCQMGPAVAFFEMVNGAVIHPTKVKVQDPRFPNVVHEDWAPTPEGGERYIYHTYACAIEGGTAEEGEARLAKHFYDQFSQLPAGSLVWRVQPSFSSEELVEYGETWMTAEQVEDGVWRYVKRDGAKWNGIAEHIYEKDGELVPPDGVELDLQSGSYKYVTKRTQLHKMRMRLVLPHLYDHSQETAALPELFKQDGALITRI